MANDECHGWKEKSTDGADLFDNIIIARPSTKPDSLARILAETGTTAASLPSLSLPGMRATT